MKTTDALRTRLPWLLAVLPVWLLPCAAQDLAAPLSLPGMGLHREHAFVQYDSNYLHRPAALNSFWAKLRRLEAGGKEEVHILHLGDSHIQADMFTGETRRGFRRDHRFPLGSRGFVFPFRAIKSNNPENYKVQYGGYWTGKRSALGGDQSRWGLAGVTAATRDTAAWLHFDPGFLGDGYAVKRVKIFFDRENPLSYMAVAVPDEGNGVVAYREGPGYLEFVFEKPQKTLKIKVEKSAPHQREFVLQGLTIEEDRPGIVYSTAGGNGAKVVSFLRCEDFAANLRALLPDLLILSLGTNDAFTLPFDAVQFKEDYRTLINTAREAMPGLPVLLTTPGDNRRQGRFYNRSNESARQAVFQLAEEAGAAVWDFYAVMGGFLSIDKWHTARLAQRDKVHLTQKGYEYQGKLFYAALMQAYAEFPGEAGRP